MNDTSANTNKFLWVFTGTTYRWLWVDLAKELAARTGLRVLFIPFTPEDKSFYSPRLEGQLDAKIALHPDYLGYVMDGGEPHSDPEEVIARAAAYEAKYGITFMRDMILGCRHIGRAFIRGGSGQPISYVAERTDHLLAVQACLFVADRFEDLAKRFPPGLVVVGGGGGGVYLKPVSLICRDRNVPFRSLVHSRFDNYYFWADSEFEESAAFTDYLHDYPEATDEDIAAVAERLRPTGLSVVGFKEIADNARWPRIINNSILELARHAYGRLRGYRLTRTGYKPWSKIRYIARVRLHRDKLNRMKLPRLDDLAGHKLVYFPLQMEPEHSLNVLSPEHTNQFATALEIALSLPADARLVIKEHPYEIGRRPEGYYKQFLELPNVTMLHPDESGIEIIKRSSLVCVITSSSAYEAAVLGKSVVHFGQHGLILNLPHAHRMSSFTNMDIIRRLLESTPEDEHRRKLDGARYFRAIEDYCSDLGPLNVHGRDHRPTAEELQLFCESILQTLPQFTRQTSSS